MIGLKSQTQNNFKVELCARGVESVDLPRPLYDKVPFCYPLLLQLLINILQNGHMTDKWMLRLIPYRISRAIGIILVFWQGIKST